jgi:hypothetical protein
MPVVHRDVFRWVQEDMSRFVINEEVMQNYARLFPDRITAKTTPSPVSKEEPDDMKEKLVNNFLVGCDPEFAILGADGFAFNVEGVIPHDGEVGYDHSGLVVEIRPKPAHGAYNIVKSLRKTINSNELLMKLSDKKWRSGGIVKSKRRGGVPAREGHANGETPLTLGGHVHFGIKPPVAGVEENHVLRIKALDRVTKYLEKLDILPEAESEVRRKEGAKAYNGTVYAQWGDWRPAGERGREDHIEYRTMASWLFDPKVAFACITASKLAASSPQLALDTLKARNISFEAFKNFVELYRFKDCNARRLLERLLDTGGLKSIHGDPESDFKNNWKELGF